MIDKTEFRMTRQREIILDELRKTTSHPTAAELYEMVRLHLPRISLGTVYRNLEILSERGLIRKLELGASQKRFDGSVGNHYHIRCSLCGKVDDAEVQPFHELENAVQKTSGYKVTGHVLEFVGVCPKCEQSTHGSHHRRQ